MTYRDRAIRCPRCGLELARADERDRWQCTKCNGALLATSEVVRELVQTAPDLVPAGGVGGITTLGRRTVAPLLDCSVCGAPMEPVFLGGVEVDRCYHDELMWFDRSELALVVDIAREQSVERTRDRSWLAKLLAFVMIGCSAPASVQRGGETVPYGAWDSPITAELANAAEPDLDEPTFGDDGIYWLEGQADGRSALMRRSPDGKVSDVLPGIDVRTEAHAYGGGALVVDGGLAGTILYSNGTDQRLYRLAGGRSTIRSCPRISRA